MFNTDPCPDASSARLANKWMQKGTCKGAKWLDSLENSEQPSMTAAKSDVAKKKVINETAPQKLLHPLFLSGNVGNFWELCQHVVHKKQPHYRHKANQLLVALSCPHLIWRLHSPGCVKNFESDIEVFFFFFYYSLSPSFWSTGPKRIWPPPT